ncbi:PP2C family protein-serine/threonine phosphatase [Nocardioides sp. MH1]|uniref:PP2C family protein-serine/threonine phosphatase n=1 Tax=Nocardioides sp. MH1 TaxID=3242490 RepID=UPI003522FDEB
MAEPLPAGPGRYSRPVRAAAITALVGVVLTVLGTWAAHRADEATEDRLLETQSKQAAAVLSTAILVIQQPLTTALQVQAASGRDGAPTVFRHEFAANVGKDGPFVAASLWRREGQTYTRLAAVGGTPGIDPRGPEIQQLLGRAMRAKTSVVELVDMGDQSRIAYAMADPATGLVVKVERAIPADRRAPVDRDSAFSELDYAIYVGDDVDEGELTTTDVDPASLPLDGRTHTEKVPFGDTYLILVARPVDHLGSPLSQQLPLILLLGGLLLTAAVALVARQVVSSRIRDETDAATISQLYETNNALYEAQGEVFVRMQRALLPQVIPAISQVEVASEYVAGTEGVEIGGDFYVIVPVGEDRFGFVVGDVSGHGVDAVAEMARARYTLRAYLQDGDGPDEALAKCSRQFDIAVDDHIVTAVVGVGTWATGEVVLANAGHPLPLVLSDGSGEYVQMPIGPPLGVGPSSYDVVTIDLPVGATILGFTDGLVERRGEDIDVGMERLREEAGRHAHEDLSELLASLLERLRGDDAADDIALLALRRTAPGV